MATLGLTVALLSLSRARGLLLGPSSEAAGSARELSVPPGRLYHEVLGDQALAQFPSNLDGIAGSGAAADKGFTILVSTFRRDGCLETVLQHWLKCHPTQLRVVWHDPNRALPRFLQDLQANGFLVVDRVRTNSLANRWLPRQFVTQAIFSVDDDMTYSCGEVRAAYEVWRQHPRRLVGFGPRLLQGDSYSPMTSYEAAWGENEANTLFVTKGGFAHAAFYEAVWSPRFAELRAKVDEKMTAEDILMSFVHASTVPSQADAVPVPLLAYHKGKVSCEEQSHAALGADPDAAKVKRSAVQGFFVARLGFPLQVANFSEFHCYDRKARSYGQSFGQRCGHPGAASAWRSRCLQDLQSQARTGDYIV